MDASVVTAASERWVWIPEDAPRIETPEFLLVQYPSTFEAPFQIQRVASDADPISVVNAMCDAARSKGARDLVIWSKLSAPAGLSAELQRRGAELAETVSVLALDLSKPLSPLSDSDVSIEQVVTGDGLTAHVKLHNELFGSTDVAPTGAARDRECAERAEHWRRGEGGDLIAYRGTVPVGIAGLTMSGTDARLWGAAVDSAFRGQGIYRALLEKRLQFAREKGARLAIVKGRVATSAPILLRVGFEKFGEENAYRLTVSS